jgi:CRP/FNR family cyclic AMP-dependent transcriptional regulator
MKTIDRGASSATALRDMVHSSIWARGLPPDELQRVITEIVVRDVPAGQFACASGERVDHWIGVIRGLLKIGNGSLDGKWTTYTGVSAGSWFGEGSLLKHERRRYSAIALCNSKIAYMPRATFERLYETSLAFSHFLVNQLNERCGQFLAMLDSDRLLGPEARTARCLAALFNPYLYPGIEQHLEISQEDIGHLSGLSRQRVNVAMHVLEKAGLVRVEIGGLTVTNLGGLRGFPDRARPTAARSGKPGFETSSSCASTAAR